MGLNHKMISHVNNDKSVELCKMHVLHHMLVPKQLGFITGEIHLYLKQVIKLRQEIDALDIKMAAAYDDMVLKLPPGTRVSDLSAEHYQVHEYQEQRDTYIEVYRLLEEACIIARDNQDELLIVYVFDR